MSTDEDGAGDGGGTTVTVTVEGLKIQVSTRFCLPHSLSFPLVVRRHLAQAVRYIVCPQSTDVPALGAELVVQKCWIMCMSTRKQVTP